MVHTLEWDRFGVKAITHDGRVYIADQAVITLPLGVLKAQKVQFIPELPVEKLAAIEQMGVTDAVKFFYHFDRPILPTGITELYVPGSIPDEWWSSSRGHGVECEILTSLATGDKARELLSLSEEEALQQGLHTLRCALGDPTLTPTQAKLAHWRDDPYTLGAWSLATVGASQARAVLAKPVGNRLFFAGEHTASNAWAATVHGAYDSGRRVVREILSARGAIEPIKRRHSYDYNGLQVFAFGS